MVTSAIPRPALVLAAMVTLATAGPLSAHPARALAAASAGCGQQPLAAPGSDYNGTIVVSGTTRTYILHVPADYQSSQPAALVFNLHGGGGTSSIQENMSGMSSAADSQNVLVVYPQAAGSPAEWNVNPPNADGTYTGVQDVPFLTSLILQLQSRMCVDPARVFFAGYSNGAAMATRMACDESSLVAAYASVAGYPYKLPCAPVHAQPLIDFHGTADPVISYYGGTSAQGKPMKSIPTVIQLDAVANGCSSTSVPFFSQNDVSAVQYTQGCLDAAIVQFYTVAGGGHTWPGGTYSSQGLKKLGPVTMTVNATNLILAFFAQHPYP